MRNKSIFYLKRPTPSVPYLNSSSSFVLLFFKQIITKTILQSMLSFHGLPLCISSITHHFSRRVAEHERRREAMKAFVRANEEMGFRVNIETMVEESMGADVNGDRASVLKDLSCNSGLGSTANAG
ncbi:hypothetical protein CXB51_021416 [Gossypium anomalum]|uniref:Uncharacterized protein n=1 Tax=Gossypium anomalum TaxID=47600 RepID=A0A8J6CVD9_9ROSI|nr:hypothetical protein CXB51_021416 [Gossypium anomalum]